MQIHNTKKRALDEIDVRCNITHRLLARANKEGLLLFCRQCNRQHLLSWQKLQNLHEDITSGRVNELGIASYQTEVL